MPGIRGFTPSLSLSKKHPAPANALDTVMRLCGGSVLFSIGVRLGWNVYNDEWRHLAQVSNPGFVKHGGLISNKVNGAVFTPQLVTDRCTILKVKVPAISGQQSALLLTAVGFRGTHAPVGDAAGADLPSGVKVVATPESLRDARTMQPRGRVDAGIGFLSRFEEFAGQIRDRLAANDREAAQAHIAHASLYTGHSLGAAAAQIAAVVDAGTQRSAQVRRNVFLFALSTPHAGCGSFFDAMADYVRHGWLSGATLQVEWDPITSVGPPAGLPPALPIFCEAAEPPQMVGKAGLHIDRHMALGDYGIDWILQRLDPSGSGRQKYSVFPLPRPFTPS